MTTSPALRGKATTARALRLGFLGIGWIGLRRLEALVRSGLVEVAVAADPVAELVEQVKEFAPNAPRVSSLAEVLDYPVDGVVIATPSALHAEQTLAALERGVPVFCQKPLGRNSGEVKAIVDAARARDLLVGVDLSYRHVRAVEAIAQLIRNGELGDIFATRLVFHNAYGPGKPWFFDRAQAGGGCVLDLGIHLVDLALWLLESKPTRVEARVFADGKPLTRDSNRVEDFASARIDLANGAVIDLACSWRLNAGQDAVIEAEFFGTRGGAALRNVNGSFVDFRAEHYRGTSRSVLVEPPDEWGGRAAVAWAERLSRDASFDPDLERQLEVARILDQIYSTGLAVHLSP